MKRGWGVVPSLIAAGFILPGCAKFPDTGGGAGSVRLALKMTMEGAVRTGLEPGGGGLPYVYIFALRLSEDASPTTSGPLPIVTPGGNGFVAGNCTHYIVWDPLGAPQYTLWRFDDASLTTSTLIGTPIVTTFINPGDKTLACEVDLTQLVPAGDVDKIQGIQVNFLTMNNRLTSGGGRLWDALGDGRNPGEINRPFLFNARSAQTYTNTNQGSLEPTGDSLDPDLDLSDWSVEVRRS